MSALDHAFIRAFTSDTAGVTAQAEKPAAASAAPAAGASPGAAEASASAVPAPHFDLSAFASSVSTLDTEPVAPPLREHSFKPVRIDPPQAAAAPPEPASILRFSVKAEEKPAASPAVPRPAVAAPNVEENSVLNPAIADALKHDLPAERPMIGFEVDHFAWPAACTSLEERTTAQLDELCRQLIAESALGRKVIGITGLARGEGRSTLALLVARRLASTGVKTALVDADFAGPQLATKLGLVLGAGWEQSLALADGPAIWDTMIESVADQLALAPLSSRTRLTVAGDIARRLAQGLQDLARHFELVLVDAGPLSIDGGAGWMLEPNSGLDAAILTTDSRKAQAGQLPELSRRLMDAQVAPLGVAENYCVV